MYHCKILIVFLHMQFLKTQCYMDPVEAAKQLNGDVVV